MEKFLLIFLVVLLVSGCTQTENNVTSNTQKSLEEVNMQLTSPAFENNGKIPSKFTCDGEDLNPELRVEGVPTEAKSLILIVDDPDAPVGVWDHWVVWDIDTETKTIEEGSVPGIQGKNSWGRSDYGGPCPPDREHRYFFKLYALDTALDLPETATKRDVEKAMQGHILAQAQLVGKYERV